VQQLQRDHAIELGIEGAVHDAHAAFAEAIEHDVAADGRAALEVLPRLFVAHCVGLDEVRISA